jgi:superfamily II DNA or RNA helicase
MQNRITLELNNNKVRVVGDIRVREKLYKEMGVKHPNAFHIRMRMNSTVKWDGIVHYMTDAGYAKIGMLPDIVKKLEEWEVPYGVLDQRDELHHNGVQSVMDGLEFRDYQIQSLRKVVYHTIGKQKIPFNKGIIDAATNAGKTFMILGIYLIYKKPTIVLISDSLLFKQFQTELPSLLPNEDIQFVQGKKRKFGNLTIAMVPTLARGGQVFKGDLAKFIVTLVDECDLATSKSYQWVLNNTFNALVRIGLSGSAFTHKDPIKNFDLKSWFGDILFSISKKELVAKGVSTKPIIKINTGNLYAKFKGDYMREYTEAIILSPERNKKILQRLTYNLKAKRSPILVVAKFHHHVDNLFKIINKAFGKKYKVAYVHHKVDDKAKIFEDFRDGKIDILISSLIVKRGKNLPLIQTIINAAGGDSQADIIQIMGRGERASETKTRFYMEDFFDMGNYMRRHSTHRIRYYKKQGFKVMQLFKQDTIKK